MWDIQCLGPDRDPGIQHNYAAPPPMSINLHHHYTATVVVSSDRVHGSFTFKLLPAAAPLAVNNFVFLARHHYFDGNIFHRVIKGFMVQTGDPTGTGTGFPGYHFKIEKTALPYTRAPWPWRIRRQRTRTAASFLLSWRQPRTRCLRTTPYSERSPRAWGGAASRGYPVTANPGSGEMSTPLTDITMTRVSVREMP
jgi:peptidylprolyl isomerase